MKFFIFTIFSSTIAMQRQLSPVERLSSVIAGLNEWKDLHLTGYKRYDSLTSKIIKTEGRLLERLQEPCAQPTPETDMEEIDDVSNTVLKLYFLVLACFLWVTRSLIRLNLSCKKII